MSMHMSLLGMSRHKSVHMCMHMSMHMSMDMPIHMFMHMSLHKSVSQPYGASPMQTCMRGETTQNT